MSTILAKYNPIDFYSSKDQRLWDNTDNEDQFIVHYETGTIPSFQLIVDSALSASMQLYDYEDNAISSPVSLTIENETDYSRIIHLGTVIDDMLPSFYYVKVTIDTSSYYSDMFSWDDDVSGFLKVNVFNIGNFDLGGVYTNNMDGFDYTFYVDAYYNGIKPDIPEESTENNGLSDITFGSRTITRTFILDCQEYLYQFISAFRILECNSTIVLTWRGREFVANDIDIDLDGELVDGDIYKVKFQFKVRNEIVSTNNNVY